MKTFVVTQRHEQTGTVFHFIANCRGREVQLTVWESPTGQLVAIGNDWMRPYYESDTDPTPALLEAYGPLQWDPETGEG